MKIRAIAARFVILPLLVACPFTTCFADTLNFGNGIADDAMYVFVGNNTASVGTLLTSGGGDLLPTAVTLTPGQNYYIEIEGINIGGAAGVVATFSLTGGSFVFANGTQSLDTTAANISYWSAAYGGTTDGGNEQQPWVTPNEGALEETGSPFGNDTMWANDSVSSPGGAPWNGQCTDCYVTFSAMIEPETPEPSTVMLAFPILLGLYGLRRFRTHRL